MAKILKKALSISLALCIIATLFTGLFAIGSSAEEVTSDLIKVNCTNNTYARLEYTKGWSTLPKGDYQFVMDCIIYEGKPTIKIGTDGTYGTKSDKLTKYKEIYVANLNKYVINFTLAEDYEGNLNVRVGNYTDSNAGVYDCANPALYKLDAAGNYEGESLINTFAADYYNDTNSTKGNTWQRRGMSGNFECLTLPEEHFKVNDFTEDQVPAKNDNNKVFYINAGPSMEYCSITYQPEYNLIPGVEYVFVSRMKWESMDSMPPAYQMAEFYYYSADDDKMVWLAPKRGYIKAEYDPENCIYKAKITIPQDAKTDGANNFKIVVGDNGNGLQNYNAWFTDFAIYCDDEAEDCFVDIKEENVYYSSAETKNAYRYPEARKSCFQIVDRGDIFPEEEVAEDTGYVPASENGKMLAFNFDENNVKAEYKSSLDCNLVPGKKYTFTMRYVSDYGYSTDKFTNMISLQGVLASGSSTAFKNSSTEGFKEAAQFTEKYDADKCLYIATFTVPDMVRTDGYNFVLKLGDRNGNGTVSGCRAYFADYSLIEEGTGRDLLGHMTIDEEHVNPDNSDANQGKKWRLYPYPKKITIEDKGDTFGAYDEIGHEVEPYIPESSNGKMIMMNHSINNIKIEYRSNLGCNLVPGKSYTFKARFTSDIGYSETDLANMFGFWYVNTSGSTTFWRTKLPEGYFKESYDADKCIYTATVTIPEDARIDDYNLQIKLGDRNGDGTVSGGRVCLADFSLVEEGTGRDLLSHIPFDADHTTESALSSEVYGKVWRLYPMIQKPDNMAIVDKGDTFGWYDQLKPVYKPASQNGKMLAFNFDTNNVKAQYNSDLDHNLVPGKKYTFKARLISDFGYDDASLTKLIWFGGNLNGSFNGFATSSDEAFKTEANFKQKYDADNCIYTATFTAPSTLATDSYNLRINLGDRNGGGDVLGGRAFFADFSLVEEGTGRDLLAHLPFDDDHIMANNETENYGKKIRCYPYGTKVTLMDKGDTFGEEEKEEGGIKADKAVTLDKVDGFVAQFVTLKPETDYAFSFRYKSESGARAVPYIEAFSDSASLGQIACTYSKQDVDGYYNYYCEFKTPAGLKNELNVRIGVNGVKTEVVSAAAFNLYELADEAATNLINEGNFKTILSIKNYDGTPSNAWAVEGTGTVVIENVFFNIPNPQVFMFAGSKNGGTITKEEKLVAGTKYIASLNLKWGSEGYEGDTGVTLSYHNGSGWKDLTATASKADGEFKNIYTFELPADARSGKANFQITVKVGSAYVTGYISNLVITTEADKETNLVTNGDFSMGKEGWTVKGLGYENSAAMPEGYFDEDCKVEKGMFFYRNSGTWDYFQHEYVTLKSNAYYLVVLNEAHPLDDVTVSNCGLAIQSSGKNSDGSYTSWLGTAKIEGTDTPILKEYTATCEKKLIITPDGLNTSGNSKVYQIIQLAGSYGYFGDLAIYESNEKGEILSNNIILNGDLRLGTACWKMSTTDGFTWRYGKQPKDFFKNFSAHADKMVTSLGTAKNAEFGQTMTLKAETKYYFTGHYVNMNGAGVTPKAYYKNAKGKWEAMEVSFFTDSDRYYFEAEIVLPAEANAIGSGDVKLVIDNGNKGKGYLSDLTLVEDGSFVNLFADANYANGLKNWTTSKNYVISKYNQEMFKFHFDDEAFDDGNWAGETTESAFTTGAIQGYVFDENGNGYKGIKMVLDGKKSDKTDKDGLYYFGDLKPGKYDLSLTSLDGTLMFIAEVEVKAGILSEMSAITFTAVQPEVEVEQEPEEEIEIEIEDTNFGIVRGYLYDVDASLLKGVKVYLGNVGETVTDENGMFQFDDVRPGKYDIYVKDTDGNISILKNVEVEAGKGAVYKVQIPFAETSTNWLVIVLICAGAAVLVAVAIKVALVIKKKNANK